MNRLPTHAIEQDPRDLLLINVSNFPNMPIYPYAFILVSTVAKRCGLSVARQDLLYVEKAQYRELLPELIARHRPRMIGIHIRQLDSLVYDDYADEQAELFLPLQTAKEVVEILRELTTIPIVLGGIGYTIQAEPTLRFLGADFGVMDGPDGFFAQFDQVLARQNLHEVPNLLYWDEDGALKRNRKVDYLPSPVPEYTAEIMREIRDFYPEGALTRIDGPSIAIEIMRGCPYRCEFCIEPKVKGRRIRERDLDVIMKDVAFVASQGVRKVWFICSELNAHLDFALRLATRMRAFNEERGNQRLYWMAYLLPTIQEKDYLTLIQSGFVPGWNDFPSLDNRNLMQNRVPYRLKDIENYLALYLKNSELWKVDFSVDARFDVFLGNRHMDKASLKNSLQYFSESGLQAHYETAYIIPATKIHRMNDFALGEKSELIHVPVPKAGIHAMTLPVFSFPPELQAVLKTPAAIRSFYRYLESTFLSRHHHSRKRWCSFLFDSWSDARILQMFNAGFPLTTISIEGDPETESATNTLILELAKKQGSLTMSWIQDLKQNDLPVHDYFVQSCLMDWLSPNIAAFGRILDYLQVPHHDGYYEMDEFAIYQTLGVSFDDNQDLLRSVSRHFRLDEDSLDALHLRYFIYYNNIELSKEYVEILV